MLSLVTLSVYAHNAIGGNCVYMHLMSLVSGPICACIMVLDAEDTCPPVMLTHSVCCSATA